MAKGIGTTQMTPDGLLGIVSKYDRGKLVAYAVELGWGTVVDCGRESAPRAAIFNFFVVHVFENHRIRPIGLLQLDHVNLSQRRLTCLDPPSVGRADACTLA